jgi:hypothetical protein
MGVMMPGKFDEFYDFRDRLVSAVERDLVGPTDSDNREVIEDPPFTKYICGVLYPQTAATVDEDQDMDFQDDEDEGVYADPPVAMAHVRYPSSMGISFAVDPTIARVLLVHVTCARYTPIVAEESDGAEHNRKRSATPSRWQRVPLLIEPAEVPIEEPLSRTVATLSPGLDLFARVRGVDKVGRVSVTLVLVNTLRLEDKEFVKDAKSFFQVQLRVSAPNTRTGAFVERPDVRLRGTDDDVRLYRLLYRHARTFAVGHGCSADWSLDSADGSRAIEVRAETCPRFALRLADTNESLPSLSMKSLAQGTRDTVLPALEELCELYEQWIAKTRIDAESLSPELRDLAETQLGEQTGCTSALNRMRSGIETLRNDEVAWKAFQLANAAMLEQRARTEWLRSGRSGEGPRCDNSHTWRPFQIAFILLCLRGLSDFQADDRKLADLLWFPTGGGKTEAYLGLIAFVVFARRLRDANADGVTALMRYTLRLLTIQQFERACLLICCCEAIRRRRKDLGATPISIGLWVGRGATPNTCEEARKSLLLLQQGQEVKEKNPMQVQACPWCGETMGVEKYKFRPRSRPCLIIACGTTGCEFKDGLPAYVVDECIYALRPSLLISTVDKFASLPWIEETANLFNLNAINGRPPDLIIQDELHLISGPLGTLTGLYETAIDFICQQSGSSPKVIASTATIRRAASQVKNLFNRDVRQFPPPATDGRFSFFAQEASPDEKGTRLYVGVMSPGTSHATLLVRVYAALLQFCRSLPAIDRTKNPYWTLVGYFNSLRVLGGAKLQVQDDVTDRITLLASESGTDERLLGEDRQIELSSRIASTEIPDSLRRMSIDLPSPDTLDVILATNMISVGVDIDRLGLMVVMGQPQATSEYIQATSRVGRKYPGLVFVLLNAARSRDRSHYESFISYHSALYRQVESTSVTPFSPRARDRALHAVLVSMARLCTTELRPNAGAANTQNLDDDLRFFVEAIADRVGAIAGGEKEATRKQLTDLILKWRVESGNVRNLVFRDFRNPARALLVSADDQDQQTENKFPTLWSLRDVDASSDLYLIS